MRLQNYFKNNIYANRGMTLENDINQTNEYYNNNNIALVYKKPTPIQVVQVEYPKNKIREAFDLTGTPIVFQFKNRGEDD